MNQSIWGDQETQFFYQLHPETILQAVETLGLTCTGRCMALNSMENRVFEIEIESDSPHPSDHFLIAKFYRPGRWNKEQILEEHEFIFDLNREEIPAIAPKIFDGQSLFQMKDQNLYFCVFPRQGGRAPQDLSSENLENLGRLLARMHNVGASKPAPHRLAITPTSFGRNNAKTLAENRVIAPHVEASYMRVVEEICELSQPLFEDLTTHRIHGDCHWGNILHRPDQGMYFIDFDDMLIGPAIQDLWLVVPGTDIESVQDRSIMIEAYQTMRDFDHRELALIEPLRALRFIHFSAWISKRWQDPAFQRAFPQFSEPNYWEIQLQDLLKQKALIEQRNTDMFSAGF
ncbi:MAG: serine/threonine protein kinase [Bdellovibrionota bacterium]